MMSDSSSSNKKAVRNCPNCNIRMSSLDLDSHVICTNCRGKSCSFEDRCDLCNDWSNDKMKSYMKHQASLERKRRAKKKAKEANIPDFVNLCTGGQDAGVSLSGEGVARDGGVDDAASSVAGSASSINVDELVASKFSQLGDNFRSTLNSDLDDKLETFGYNIVKLIDQKFMELSRKDSNVSQDVHVLNPSLTAPQEVPGQLRNARQSPPSADLQQGSESHGVMRVGPVPSGNLESSPFLSPEATR